MIMSKHGQRQYISQVRLTAWLPLQGASNTCYKSAAVTTIWTTDNISQYSYSASGTLLQPVGWD
jgi:hypothetical protein